MWLKIRFRLATPDLDSLFISHIFVEADKLFDLIFDETKWSTEPEDIQNILKNLAKDTVIVNNILYKVIGGVNHKFIQLSE